MRVLLKRAWYSPDRRLYLVGENDVPRRFKDKLPSTAKVLGEPEEEEEAKAEPETFLGELNGVNVTEGKNAYFTLSYTKDDEAVEEKVQGLDKAKARAEELRNKE